MSPRFGRWLSELSSFGQGFWALTLGELVQLLGLHLGAIAVSAYGLSLVGSPSQYALMHTMTFLPWALFSAMAGSSVDRFQPKRVLILGDWARVALLVSYPFCKDPKLLLALNFASSTARVVATIAKNAVLPRVCDRELLLRANGLRAALFGLIDLVGPTAAGFLIARLGGRVAFPTAAAFVLVGTMFFLGMTERSLPREYDSWSSPGSTDTGKFLREKPGLVLSVLGFSAFTVAQNSINSIFYPYLSTALGRDTRALGLTMSLYIGSRLIVGALIVRGGHIVSKVPMTVITLLSGLTWLCYSRTSSLSIVLAGSVIEGIAFWLLSTLFQTRLQTEVPTPMLGRLLGLANTSTSTGEVLGTLVAAGLTKVMSIRQAFGVIAATEIAAVTTLSARGWLVGRRKMNDGNGGKSQ